jgi:hypothetical protein
MASVVRIKRSSVSGNPTILAAGELAYSGLADTGSNGGDRLYIGLGTETDGNAANRIVIGGKFFTDMVTAATNLNTVGTLVKRDASGNFTASTITAALIGNASTATTLQTARAINGVSFNGSTDITVHTAGTGVSISGTTVSIGQAVATSSNVTFNQVTASLIGNASTATKWATARDLSLTGDATATITGVDGSSPVSAALTLATVNAAVGTYGSTIAVPIITVNAKGLVTSVTTATISGSAALTIAGTTGTDVVALGTDTLSFVGGTGITTAVTNNQVSISVGQDISTNANPTFNNLTLSGNLLVQGTTTTINSTTLAVGDINIVVAKDALSAAAADGAGLTVNGANATFTYSAVDDRWNLNKNLNVTTVYGALVGNASTATKWTTSRTLSLTGDATASLLAVDGLTNVSASLTLASVNSNIGSFGTGIAVPNITVNAKGLITAVSTTAIPTASTTVQGLAQFDATQFIVTAGVVTINTIDGGTF